MRVAVAQMAPGEERERNVEDTLNVLRSAAAQGAELVVLPEMCTSPYMLAGAEPAQWAEEIPAGRAVQSWLRASSELGITIVAGVLEREASQFYNTAICLNQHGLVARYRKTHLFGWERRCLTAGEAYRQTGEIEGVRLGMLICYDLRFVEVVRALALGGIQLLCVPTTWTDVGKPQPFDKFGLPGAAHLALGQAYANKVFVLCAGRVGREKGVGYLGSSLIAGPNGHALAGPAGSDREEILIADIEPATADQKQIGSENHIFKDRRIDLYS